MGITATPPYDPTAAIVVRNLQKAFDSVQAVDGVSFTVQQGEMFGFLGPNGAGKTTTISILTGLARADSGDIAIAGIDCVRDVKAVQHLIGVVPDESNLYPELTGFENLCFCASLYGMRKAERVQRTKELVETFGLADAANRKFAGYSKGMKRKLTIAAGIIHSPPILFLDEPTTGIDVAGARQIRRVIGELHRSGTTIFLTTHYIEEAERLCSRIAFIVSGKVIRVDMVKNLLRQVEGRHMVEFSVTGNADKLCSAILNAFPGHLCRAVSDHAVRVESSDPVKIGPLLRLIEERGAEVSEARKIEPSLEDVFVEITGIEAAAMKKEKAEGRA